MFIHLLHSGFSDLHSWIQTLNQCVQQLLQCEKHVDKAGNLKKFVNIFVFSNTSSIHVCKLKWLWMFSIFVSIF